MAPVPTGKFQCPLTNGEPRSRIWHWNGTSLVAGPWSTGFNALPDAWVELADVSNGCTGPQGLGKWTFWNLTRTKKYTVNFREACDLHDAGYSGAKVNDPLNGGRVIDYFGYY